VSTPGEYHHVRPRLAEVIWNRVAEADRLIVYSLFPDTAGGGEGCDRLHDYPILRQVDVVDSRITDVYSSLRVGEEEEVLGRRRCFIPRHGVRAIRDDIALDLVICFQCASMAVYESSESESVVWADIGESPQALLNELLGITLDELLVGP
jgi:hypothetical protein